MNLEHFYPIASALGAPGDPAAAPVEGVPGLWQISILTVPSPLASGHLIALPITEHGGSAEECLQRYRRRVVFEYALLRPAFETLTAQTRAFTLASEAASTGFAAVIGSP